MKRHLRGNVHKKGLHFLGLSGRGVNKKTCAQVWGYVPDKVEVPELGATFSTWDILDALAVDPDRVP